jgi:hypothetical protein
MAGSANNGLAAYPDFRSELTRLGGRKTAASGRRPSLCEISHPARVSDDSIVLRAFTRS